MAYVVRDCRGRSPFWYAVFRDASGRRLKKSTQLTSKSKALEIARTLDKASREARQRTLTEARTRELLSEVLQAVNGGGLRVFTVAEWLDHFVAQKRKSRSDKTAERYAQVMREFIESLGSRSNLNIAAITSKDIAEFRDKRHSCGLAPTTVNQDVAALSTAFNAALRQGHITVNRCLAIEPLKDVARRKETFTPEQVSALVRVAEGDWKGVIITAFYTGQRFGDCINIRWRDVDLVSEIKTIRFVPRKTSGKVVVIAIHPALEDYLLSLPTATSDNEFIFPSLAGRPISPLSTAFRRLMAAAYIEQWVIRTPSGEGSGRNVNALSFHSLRHSFTSILANAGVSEELRMLLTGHTTRAIHQRYSHHDLERLRDAVAVLPRV